MIKSGIRNQFQLKISLSKGHSKEKEDSTIEDIKQTNSILLNLAGKIGVRL